MLFLLLFAKPNVYHILQEIYVVFIDREAKKFLMILLRTILDYIGRVVNRLDEWKAIEKANTNWQNI